MGGNTSKRTTSSTDSAINSVLRNAKPLQSQENDTTVFYFNQGEDQFILLDTPLQVLALPIHHNLDNPQPPKGYREAIHDLVSFLAKHTPQLITQTRWTFDPRTIHTPTFYRVEEYEGQAYLYMVLIDLTCRALEAEIIEPGTNDRTHAYRTNKLYFECDYFPLNGLDPDSLVLNQTIPVTWKGESGEGYMVHGIWMDSDINKFFTKLVLPTGKRNHPYYPITCKQHCVSMNAYGMDSPALLHKIRPFIEGNLDRILQELQHSPFSETSLLYNEIKASFPDKLGKRWENLNVIPSLNERDEKEYSIEF